MDEHSEIPTELLDSVREALGRVKVVLKVRVQLEVKEKLENRVLVLCPHRVYLLTPRVPAKVEQSFSLLDLQGVSSNKPNQLLLEYDRGSWLMRLGSASETDNIISSLGLCLQQISPSTPPPKLMKKVSLKPSERTAALQNIWDEQNPDTGPCGGFSHQYWCVCDHLGLPYREEVQWDVDTIYLTQDSRELNLLDFTHLENRDLVPIIAALEFNQWFTRLSVRDYKLPTEVVEQVLRVVSRSSRLEELLLDNTGLRSDFAVKLAVALSQNPASCLHSLDLSNNALEDKGVSALSAQLAKLPLGLKQLNLSRTSLSTRGVNSVCAALSSNPAVSSSLTTLNLSSNALRGDDLQHLHSFLSQSNCLKTLDLSNSDCSLEQVCVSLLRGSLKHLCVLNMSRCVYSHRKVKEIPVGFKQFFSSALSLSSVSLSGTKLPLEALKALLLGLGCNPHLSDVTLDLSCCELRSAGSQILEGCIAEIPNISSLDISDNGLDMDLLTLLVWLSKNRSIRHLSLGKNFSNIKSKNLSQVMDNLVHLIQEEDSPLSSLSLADSRLKQELSMVLNALGSNSSLTSLDISGNSMGDIGAKMLAKALQINSKLRTIIWDRNSVSPQGLQDMASALEKNFTIRFMPVPIADAAQALKTNPEKTEDALLKMEQYLLRNHETRKYLQEQAYRLQQGIVTTTTQQMMDTMCVRVQDHLNSLKFSESRFVQDDVKRAQHLMKDAKNSKTLLPNLYHLKNSAPSGPCVGVIQDTLESMAGELCRVMDQQLQSMLVSMLDTAQALCPHVMKRSGMRQELLQKGSSRMNIPQSFISNTLLQQSGVDIVNKMSEVKLGLASFVSDRIVDEILESLSQSQLTLADHVTRKGHPLVQDPHSETEVLSESELQQEEEGLVDRKQDVDSCMMTKSKRKSILVRMLRPVSVAFELEFDLDKALEEVPIHVEDPPPPPHAATSLDRPADHHHEVPPPDLPPVQHQTLSHQTKSRPKPKNRSKPSRYKRAPAPSAAVEEDKLDEGLDEFFFKTVSKLSFRKPLTKTNSQETEKKRDSRRSGFFNYIKSRTSRSEKSHSAPSAAITPPAAAMIPPASSSPPPPASSSPPPAAHIPLSTPLSTPPSEAEEEPPPSVKTTDLHEDLHKSQEPTNEGEKVSHDVEREAAISKPEPAPQAPQASQASQASHTPPPGPAGSAGPPPGGLPGGPPGHRHIGVPVLGMGLMAEMKARQEKRAAQKSEALVKTEKKENVDKVNKVNKVDSVPAVTAEPPHPPPPVSPHPPLPPPPVSPILPPSTAPPPLSPPPPSTAPPPLSPPPPVDLEESRPEPAPRSKPRTSQDLSSPVSPTVCAEESPEAPLPAPRLKRAPSENNTGINIQVTGFSEVVEVTEVTATEDGVCAVDGGVFVSPVSVGLPDVRASSLKRLCPESRSEERERAQSLPAYVSSLSSPGTKPGLTEDLHHSHESEEED